MIVTGSTTMRILKSGLVAAGLTTALAAGSLVRAQEHAPAQQPAAAAHDQPAAHDAAAAEHGSEEAAHDESIWPQVGKIVNFLVLLGTIVYFGRKPIADYLASRGAQVRSELVEAEKMKTTAAAQIAEMDAKLAALPGELAALKARGDAEIAAEQQRLRAVADAERQRLLDQTTRDIDQKLRMARRELVEHAAALAVQTAEHKINAQITDADRSRLVDRYLAEVKGHE